MFFCQREAVETASAPAAVHRRSCSPGITIRDRLRVLLPTDPQNYYRERDIVDGEELRDFIADDEAKPKTMLYPRDPSLDPQLVWKGKDEQDQADLAVPVVGEDCRESDQSLRR